ncbi:MAG: hypothetical protein GF418_14220 [Chitinivibrionales bacterium]|nr:hypothetical protein [Chitinivibrionales bacterium]MBD3396775.1 hypothetical protein [Chitinivibrionales bacterium]
MEKKMTLQNWADNGWLRAHKTSPQEIKNLLGIVERDTKDSRDKGLSADWRFGIAYNAALKLCTILMYAEGFRPEKALAHYRTLRALPLILGSERDDEADYLDRCRTKRNTVEYDYVGGATDSDAEELIAFTEELEKDVRSWLKEKHPELL